MNRVQEIRKKKGWSQTRLAKETDLSRTMISIIERSSDLPVKLSTALQLAAALDVAVYDPLPDGGKSYGYSSGNQEANMKLALIKRILQDDETKENQ